MKMKELLLDQKVLTLDGNVGLLANQLVYHFGRECNISTTLGWVSLMMNPAVFGDHFHPAPSSGQSLSDTLVYD